MLVVSLHGHPEAVGVGAATVAGPGAAVTGYVVDLSRPARTTCSSSTSPAGTILHVDQDDEEHPGEVLVQRYRWPEFDD